MKDATTLGGLEGEVDHLDKCNNIKGAKKKSGSSWKNNNIKRPDKEYDHVEKPTTKGLEHKG